MGCLQDEFEFSFTIEPFSISMIMGGRVIPKPEWSWHFGGTGTGGFGRYNLPQTYQLDIWDPEEQTLQVVYFQKTHSGDGWDFAYFIFYKRLNKQEKATRSATMRLLR